MHSGIFDDEAEEQEPETNLSTFYKPKDDKLFGSCILQIRLENHAEYLKWKKYNGPNERWDFLVQYPAIMRCEYKFHKTQDLDVITRKIVQLLQMGFKVSAASWQLEEYNSQLKQPL